jgi:hypothetical protein
MRDDQLISAQTVQSPFNGLSFAVSFRRRHRCAPVTHRATGEMLAILFWCAPAFGDLLLAMALDSLNDESEGSSREDRRLLPHLITRTTGAHGHSVSHTGALR